MPLSRKLVAALLPAVVIGGLLVSASSASANVAVTQVSSDPFTDAQAQHRTEVEPGTFAFGTTIVSAFQVGRVSGGGSSDIGFATSADGGATWTSGFLPGTTANTGGPCGQISDAAVAFDAKHNVWLISSLGVNCPSGTPVFTSRSTDGGKTFGNPITTATGSLDKNWIVCDNTAASPFFGNCYTQYDITSSGDSIRMKTSSDGGLTWGPARAPAGAHTGLGGQPVVQPNGTVVVPYLSLNDQIRSFRSTNGGASWTSTVAVATISHHDAAGGLREEALPTAEIDSAGIVYVAWSDCRFRSGCPSNDIVLSKSANGTTWSAPTRVPIDATTSTVDHFVPGVGVDASTSGTSARIGLTYYFYPTANCTAATCQLDVGFISSTDGGTSWSTATQVAGPMSLSWIPNTSQGRMFGDYISTSVRAGGNAFPIVPIASAPSGSTFTMGMFAPTGGLPLTGGARRTADTPAPQTTATQSVVTAF
ncbi:sialidase family protein [Amycolatopsis mongoliensis]|uniref:Sialidase family protein n=1 Tax=Amycolatopsis mongoliensis TaxID=715475 RepID=A0A9Y2JJ93_9PSEU|nr:sialidase family protein [Amycolatopsis sp. 4-36]WIX98301.1 sialidase family protein [Amycolatopsis sp. 4-36]